MNYAIVNVQNIVERILAYGKIDGKTYSKQALAGLTQDEKDALGLKDIIRDARPSYDEENEKLVLNPLEVGDTYRNETWSIVALTDEEHNAVIESKLAQMDAEDMPRTCEDIIDALTAAGYDIRGHLPQATLDKKSAKEAERAKIRK